MIVWAVVKLRTTIYTDMYNIFFIEFQHQEHFTDKF